MKKRNRFIIVAVIVGLVIIGIFIGFGVLAAPSTECSAFVAIAQFYNNYEQNSILVTLNVVYSGPAVNPLEGGLEQMEIEIIPGDSVIVIGQKMTAVVLARATELGYPLIKSNIALPAYQKGG